MVQVKGVAQPSVSRLPFVYEIDVQRSFFDANPDEFFVLEDIPFETSSLTLPAPQSICRILLPFLKPCFRDAGYNYLSTFPPALPAHLIIISQKRGSYHKGIAS